MLWFWGAYLQLDDFDNDEGYATALGKHKLYQLGNVGAVNPLLRLCYPQLMVPSELKSKSAPTIFVNTSTGDPLHDDGIDLINVLQQEGVSVNAFECFGSHGVSVVLDNKWRHEFIKEWSKSIWP